MQQAVRTNSWPQKVEVTADQQGTISIMVTNVSEVIDAYEVEVFGLDPAWTVISPSRLSLFPNDTGTITIDLQLPPDYPACERTVMINVKSEIDPDSFSLSEIELTVEPITRTTVRADPVMVTGGSKATFGLVVANDGNADATVTGVATDPEDLAEFTFEPPIVTVPAGQEQVIRVTAVGGRAWFGQHRARTFTLGVDAEERVETIATFVQRPRIGRWILSLLGLLAAVAVFWTVLNNTFNRVVDEARVGEGILDQALANEEEPPPGGLVATDPASLTGSLVGATSDAGLGGVQVELFAVNDTSTPVASSVTDEEGDFVLGSLSEGDYKLLMTGPGIDELWFPGLDSPADAATITIGRGVDTELGAPMTVGGLPVPVSGKVDVPNAEGVVVSLLVEGVLDPEERPLVAQVQLEPDGSFVMPDVPSPGEFVLVVEAPGVSPVERQIVLKPGVAVEDVQVSLLPSAGVISGVVLGAEGPLGGATVSANDGTRVVETVSLTEDEVGSFTLQGLATPAQYTVTVSLEGFGTEVNSVLLRSSEEIENLDVRLAPASGSVEGSVSVDRASQRGLFVTITGGDVDLRTPVVSQGENEGFYQFSGLPVPGVYTLTFQGPDVTPQVRVVELSPEVSLGQVTGIDVGLRAERVTVRGVVVGPDELPAAQTTVTLSDGSADNTFTFLTADAPDAGEFIFTNVAPGAYTVTAQKKGTAEVVQLLNVEAGSPDVLNIQLGESARLNGTVTGAPSTTAFEVRLFVPAQFPSGEPEQRVATADGEFELDGLDAPESFIVALYASGSAADPLDSVVVTTRPGDTQSVPPLQADGLESDG